PSDLSTAQAIVPTHFHTNRLDHADISDGRFGAATGGGTLHRPLSAALLAGFCNVGDPGRLGPAGLCSHVPLCFDRSRSGRARLGRVSSGVFAHGPTRFGAATRLRSIPVSG